MKFFSRSRAHALAVALASFAMLTGGAPLTPPAFSQTADVTLQDVRLAVGEMSYSAPRVEFRGTNLSREALTRIFDAIAPEPLADRVRLLNAASIVIPEMSSNVTLKGSRQSTTYRDVVLTAVSGGKIASMVAAGGTVENQDARGTMKGGFDRITVSNIDLDLAVALFASKAPPNTPLKPIYSGFTLDGISLTDPSGTRTRVGKMSGRDLLAKPTSSGWMATLAAMSAQPDLQKASPAERKQSLDAMAEMFDSFGIGSMEASDIAFEGGSGKDAGAGKVQRVVYNGASGTAGGELKLEGIDAGGQGTRVRLATISMGGLSMKSFIDILRIMGNDPNGALNPADVRKIGPIFTAIGLNGLDVELPPGSPATTPSRFSLAQIELKAEKPVEGIPSDMRFTIRNAAFQVPPNADNDALKEIASLGYDKIDASMGLSLAWNDTAQELTVRDISVDGADMGSVVLRAVLGNVTRDLFNPDTALASVAALSVTAKSLELGIDNRGLFERFVAREGKRQKRNPEDIRREYGMAAAVGIPAILGNSAPAKALSQAIAKFVAKPGRLMLKARAKQPAGYGMADFAAGSDPSSILNALDITATAE